MAIQYDLEQDQRFTLNLDQVYLSLLEANGFPVDEEQQKDVHKLGLSIGTEDNYYKQKSKELFRQGRLSLAIGDELDRYGVEFSLPRNSAELDDAYRARLQAIFSPRKVTKPNIETTLRDLYPNLNPRPSVFLPWQYVIHTDIKSEINYYDTSNGRSWSPDYWRDAIVDVQSGLSSEIQRVVKALIAFGIGILYSQIDYELLEFSLDPISSQDQTTYDSASSGFATRADLPSSYYDKESAYIDVTPFLVGYNATELTTVDTFPGFYYPLFDAESGNLEQQDNTLFLLQNGEKFILNPSNANFLLQDESRIQLQDGGFLKVNSFSGGENLRNYEYAILSNLAITNLQLNTTTAGEWLIYTYFMNDTITTDDYITLFFNNSDLLSDNLTFTESISVILGVVNPILDALSMTDALTDLLVQVYSESLFDLISMQDSTPVPTVLATTTAGAGILAGVGIPANDKLLPLRNDLFLDNKPSVFMAYSLRKLKSSYTGFDYRVRNALSGATRDIGFKDLIQDSQETKLFTGNATSTVQTLYNQASLTNHLINASVNFQPQLFTTGVENRISNQPFLRTNNSAGILTVSNASLIANLTAVSCFIVAYHNTSGTTQVLMGFGGLFTLSYTSNNRIRLTWDMDGQTGSITSPDNSCPNNVLQCLGFMVDLSTKTVVLMINGAELSRITIPGLTREVFGLLPLSYAVSSSGSPIQGGFTEVIVSSENNLNYLLNWQKTIARFYNI